MTRRTMNVVLGVVGMLCLATVAVARQDASGACVECGCAPASTLSITATGSVEIDPDRAIVSVGVVEEAATARAAMHGVNTKLAAAKGEIESLEIRGMRLSTSNVSVYPVYESRPARPLRGENEAPTIVGYRASNTLRVQIDDIARTGEVIDASVASGVNQLEGVEFTSRDPFEAQTRALAEATMRAKTKANVMAGAMGATIARVVSAQESGASVPPSPRYARAESMMMSDMAPTPIEAGTLTIRASVSITYELEFTKE